MSKAACSEKKAFHALVVHRLVVDSVQRDVVSSHGEAVRSILASLTDSHQILRDCNGVWDIDERTDRHGNNMNKIIEYQTYLQQRRLACWNQETCYDETTKIKKEKKKKKKKKKNRTATTTTTGRETFPTRQVYTTGEPFRI